MIEFPPVAVPANTECFSNKKTKVSKYGKYVEMGNYVGGEPIAQATEVRQIGDGITFKLTPLKGKKRMFNRAIKYLMEQGIELVSISRK